MKTTATVSAIPSELRIELQQTLADIAKGVRDPEKMKAAAERMDRVRERNRRLSGESDIGVDIIREMRDGREIRHRHRWPSNGRSLKPTPTRRLCLGTISAWESISSLRPISFQQKLPTLY